MTLSDKDQKSEKFKVTLLQKCIGYDALKMLKIFKFAPNENRALMPEVIKKFEEVVIGEQKEFFNRNQF